MLKLNSRPKRKGVTSKGVQSFVSLVKAKQIKGAKKKAPKVATFGTSKSTPLASLKNKNTTKRTTSKIALAPHRVVHIVSKATANEIADKLAIKPETFATVRQIIRDLETNNRLTSGSD
jgi:hypothetical protein